jgi:hypothetical protein
MKPIKQVLSGICIVVFGYLGAYCSLRAIQIHRQLNGQVDIDDSVRDWSSGASACFVACGVITVLARKKQEMSSAEGQPPFKWWKTPVGITVILAVCVVAVITVILFLHQSRPVQPVEMPRPTFSLPSPQAGSATK